MRFVCANFLVFFAFPCQTCCHCALLWVSRATFMQIWNEEATVDLLKIKITGTMMD